MARSATEILTVVEGLTHLALIWGGVYIAGYLANKTKLTPVLYFLAFGCLMVNIGWLPVETTAFIQGFAEVGIILIMFALGFEESTDNFLKTIKRAWGIAFFGALVPFTIAYSVAVYFWHDRNMAILVGLAMTATAVSLTMVSLKAEGLQSSRVATGIMTSAVLDSIASLALVAILLPLALGGGGLSAAEIGIVVLKALAFFVVIAVIGGWLFPHDMRHSVMRNVPFLKSYGVRHFLAVGSGEHATLAMLLLAVTIGILAHFFGLHPAIGAYMAGLILKEEYFRLTENNDTQMYQNNKRIIDNVAFSWIGPVFFVGLGAKLVFEWSTVVAVIPETLVLTAGLIIGQITSAALAARYTAGFTFAEAMMVGFGMLGRAELAFVVMDIAYVEHSIFTKEAFYTLMITAFWLNLAVPVTIKLWKPYFLAAQASGRGG